MFPLLLGLQSRPYLQTTRAVLPPEGEQRDEATIYLELARAAGTPLWGSWLAQYGLEAAKWAHGKLLPKQTPQVPQELLLSLLLLATGNGSFGRLVRERHRRLRSRTRAVIPSDSGWSRTTARFTWPHPPC